MSRKISPRGWLRFTIQMTHTENGIFVFVDHKSSQCLPKYFTMMCPSISRQGIYGYWAHKKYTKEIWLTNEPKTENHTHHERCQNCGLSFLCRVYMGCNSAHNWRKILLASYLVCVYTEAIYWADRIFIVFVQPLVSNGRMDGATLQGPIELHVFNVYSNISPFQTPPHLHRLLGKWMVYGFVFIIVNVLGFLLYFGASDIQDLEKVN